MLFSFLAHRAAQESRPWQLASLVWHSPIRRLLFLPLSSCLNASCLMLITGHYVLTLSYIRYVTLPFFLYPHSTWPFSALSFLFFSIPLHFTMFPSSHVLHSTISPLTCVNPLDSYPDFLLSSFILFNFFFLFFPCVWDAVRAQTDFLNFRNLSLRYGLGTTSMRQVNYNWRIMIERALLSVRHLRNTVVQVILCLVWKCLNICKQIFVIPSMFQQGHLRQNATNVLIE